MDMKVFAAGLAAVCLAVGLAGACLGVSYYFIQTPVEDAAFSGSGSAVADSVVQMPENQPNQQQNPPTKPTPLPTTKPGETTIMHTYIFILKDDLISPDGYSVFEDIYKFENFYDATYGVGKFNASDQQYFRCVTVGLFKEANSEQIDFLKQISLGELGIVYVAEKMHTAVINSFLNGELMHAATGFYPSSGITRYNPAEFLDLFFLH